MIRQLNLRILKKKMARWPPSGHHWAVVLERGGVWDQLALSSSAETKTQRDSSQQVPPHHSTQLTTTLWRISTPGSHISPTYSLSVVSSFPAATSPLLPAIDCYPPIFPEP